MGDRRARTRSFLDRQFRVVVVVLVVLSLVGGWVTYGAYVDPGTTTEERTVSSWSTTGEYRHSATVTETNPLYPVGETLSNQSTYLPLATPVLNGSLVFAYDASDSGNLSVRTERRVLVRSVEDRRRRTVEVWRRVRDRETDVTTGLGPGGTVGVPFSVNVNRTMNRTERIEEELREPPGSPRLEILTTVTLTGIVNGRVVNRTETYAMVVTFDRGAYRVNATESTQRFETTRTVVVPREPGPLESVGGPLVLGVGLLGLVALFAARSRDELALTDAERARLTFEEDRSEFDEWINVIDPPSEVNDLPRARAASLADLVDFAIDTDNSVIEDPEDGAYYVIHDRYCYTYEPPQSGTATGSPSRDGENAKPGDADDGTEE